MVNNKQQMKSNQVEQKFKIVPEAKQDSWLKESILAELNHFTQILCPECNEVLPTRLSATTHFKMHLKPFCCICFCQMRTEAALIIHANQGHPTVAHLITKPYSKNLKHGLSVIGSHYLDTLPKIMFSRSGRKIQRPNK